MGRPLPLLLLSMTFFAAMAFVATADNLDPHRPEPRWVPVPLAEKDHHIQELGKSAVDMNNKQNRARLYFLHVTAAEKLERGPGHNSYRLLIKALPPHRHHPEFYKSLVMEDSAHHHHHDGKHHHHDGKPADGKPAVSLGYFVPAHNLH